ncbi:ABC transporter permease [Amphibacillus sediminis]|uniref:ABC transporter permease n=1 Tax=Amphibacillus sediminis TaxID=360185 RepID=UPI000833E5F0|nr:ABC transporter permease [Amphibacillus sediminis]
MLPVHNLQWLRLIREPLIVLSFFGLTLIFVFFLAGNQDSQIITIRTFSDQMTEDEAEPWLEQLNQSDAYQFEWHNRDEIERLIRNNQLSFALELEELNYRFLVGQNSQFLMPVNQHVENIYRTELRLAEVTEQFPDANVEHQNYIETEISALSGDSTAGQEAGIQVLVGMTLYFVMYTLLFSVSNIVIEKRSGTWNRLIFSPLKKTQIYLGQILHYFLLGLTQVGLCFFIFHYFMGYDFGDQYWAIIILLATYVFTIVALGVLVSGLVQSPQQLQAIIPIISTATAMLGGAFWPIELVSNNFLLALSKVVPIFYGIEALKDAILYGSGLTDIIQPISILLLMGVLFMGIGINLMERTN